MSDSNYKTDFYAWANEQAALLRAGHLANADIENIAEEIESMGKRERQELVSRLSVLLMHLLKWQYQPGYRGRSWQLSIEEQRFKVIDHMDDNPSLKSQVLDAIMKAYRYARIDAARETGLDLERFPPACPWKYQKMMDGAFWPD